MVKFESFKPFTYEEEYCPFSKDLVGKNTNCCKEAEQVGISVNEYFGYVAQNFESAKLYMSTKYNHYYFTLNKTDCTKLVRMLNKGELK